MRKIIDILKRALKGRKTSLAFEDNQERIDDYIDCGKNPRDLRPVLRAIMEAENWILERIGDKKLVIIIAEHHAAIAELALTQALCKLHHLSQKQSGPNFAVGFEAPNNKREIANERYGLGHWKRSCTRPDPDGKISLKMWIETLGPHIFQHNRGQWAPVAEKKLAQFLLENGISTSFNDIDYEVIRRTFEKETPSGGKVFMYGDAINTASPLTIDVITRFEPEMLNMEEDHHKFCRLGKTGAKLSNRAMAIRASEHMERTRSDIYIQRTGYAHSLHDRAGAVKEAIERRQAEDYDPLEPEDCLENCFDAEKYEVLTVSFDESTRSKDLAPKSNQHVIRIDGLTRTLSRYSDFVYGKDSEGIAGIGKRILARKAEKREWNSIKKASGNALN